MPTIRNVPRGSAIPEVALTVAICMVLLLGAVQLSLVGSTQAQADGASYVAAHSLSRDPTATATAAAGFAHSVFGAVNAADPTWNVSRDNDQAFANYEPKVPWIGILGKPLTLRSHTIEPQLPAAGGGQGSFNVYIPLTPLTNYIDGSVQGFTCAARLNCQSGGYLMYVEQYEHMPNEQGSGHGKARFDEFSCHSSFWSSLLSALPSSLSTKKTTTFSSTVWSDEMTIYSHWDATQPGAFSSC